MLHIENVGALTKMLKVSIFSFNITDVKQTMTTNKARWHDNNDSAISLSSMNMSFLNVVQPMSRPHKITPIVNFEIRSKVADWAKRNEMDLQRARDEGRSLLKTFDTVYDEGFRSGSDVEDDSGNEHRHGLSRLHVEEEANTFNAACDEFLPPAMLKDVKRESRLITLIRNMKLAGNNKARRNDEEEQDAKIPGGAECETAFGRKFTDHLSKARSKHQTN